MPIELENKDNPAFAGKTEKELKIMAMSSIMKSAVTGNRNEVLELLQNSSEALKACGLTVEDLKLKMSDIDLVAKRAYYGSASEEAAVDKIAANILSTFPQAKNK
jgi:hypothetical protein